MSNALRIEIEHEGKGRGRAVALALARLVIVETAQRTPLSIGMREVAVGRKGRKKPTRK